MLVADTCSPAQTASAAVLRQLMAVALRLALCQAVLAVQEAQGSVAWAEPAVLPAPPPLQHN